MSSRWHYRIHGRDVGPVDFATLQVMAKEERLFVDDEIRDESSPQWVLAGAVAGLFPESADEDDLSSMLSDGDMPALEEDRADSEDACFCRTRSEELGPMSFDRLIALARMGRIGRRDQVRIGSQGEWVEARSVAGLFEAPVAPATHSTAATAEMKAAATMLDTMEIVADQTPRKARAPRGAPEPVLRVVDEGLDEQDDVTPVSATVVGGTTAPVVQQADVPDTEAMWHCRVLGQEIGPISWKDLRELVESRQLGPNDRVRKGQAVAWVPAANIENLFLKRKKARLAKKKKEKISEEDVLDILQPDEPDEEEVSSHLAPQRNFGKPGRASSPEMPARPAARGSDPEMNPRPAPAPSPPTGGMAAAMRAAVPPPPRPAPPKRETEKVPFSERFSGFSEGLTEGLASAWKPIVGVAAALLIVVAVIYGGASFMSSKSKELYPSTSKMWREAQKLRSQKSESGWETFRDRYSGRVSGVADVLAPEAGDPLADALIVAYRDCWPKMMDAPIDGANDEWAKMEENMKKADTLMGGG